MKLCVVTHENVSRNARNCVWEHMKLCVGTHETTRNNVSFKDIKFNLQPAMKAQTVIKVIALLFL
jgi:hypothetical protein